MRLEGKVAIVTGGSQGIGEAIAVRYASEGARVAIIYHRHDDLACAVIERITTRGGVAHAIKADCSQTPEIERMVAETMARFGTIDILVNNAAVYRLASVAETTEALWDEVMDLNLRGVFFCVRAVLPVFLHQGGGKVVNISSIAGVGAFPNCPAYCASKGGLEMLTKALASELGRHGINVNALAPGNVAVPGNAHLRRSENDSYLRWLRSRTPTGRDFLTADEIAGAAVFLASADAAAIHGATMMVDAGWSAW